MKLKWQKAPVKTQWGDEMVVASVAIDKDHTVCLYCERDQTSKVDSMFAQPAQQEPVDFASLLREAEELVREKPTWKRFIEGTPLSNDIAVWMTVFAQDVARRTSPPAQRTWVGLTDEEIVAKALHLSGLGTSPDVIQFARAIEAKLRSKNEDRN